MRIKFSSTRCALAAAIIFAASVANAFAAIANLRAEASPRCDVWPGDVAVHPPPRPNATNRMTPVLPTEAVALRQTPSWKIAIAPHSGAGAIDDQIRRAQEYARSSADPRPQLEQLGWLYVAKARSSLDAGFYKLAEQCALTIQAEGANCLEALLLRGHVAQSLHRFKEAESIARELTARREVAFDFGLLGDALADQGKLDEAIVAYQRMIDLRPDLQSYSRVAHVRWLKGDLSGAIDVAKLAARAGSPADAEPAAWAWTRLASYEFQAGADASAEAACRSALEMLGDYPPALLLRGKRLLYAGSFSNAVEILHRAAAKNPLPEYEWTLADALRAAGRTHEAIPIETSLKRGGVASDPRTLALFLVTRGEQGDRALRLVEGELKKRSDVFTHDALAWALGAAGRSAEAWGAMERALAEGTQDARLFLHAAVIAGRLGRDDAGQWFARARELERLLLPSERQHLEEAQRLFSVGPDRAPGARVGLR